MRQGHRMVKPTGLPSQRPVPAAPEGLDPQGKTQAGHPIPGLMSTRRTIDWAEVQQCFWEGLAMGLGLFSAAAIITILTVTALFG